GRLQSDYERRKRRWEFDAEPTPAMRKRILKLFKEGSELLKEPWADDAYIDRIMTQYLPDYYAGHPPNRLKGKELEKTIREMKLRCGAGRS
ncbi:unnamed protein product, partial [marine sediment metagenome]